MLNPVDAAADRWGLANTVALGVLGLFAFAELTPEGSVLTLGYVLVVGALFAVSDGLSTAPDGNPELSNATELYSKGEIQLPEYDSRVDAVLGSSGREVRAFVGAVDGVGPAGSAHIADRFGSLEALGVATVGELAEVRAVDRTAARAVHSHMTDRNHSLEVVDRAAAEASGVGV